MCSSGWINNASFVMEELFILDLVKVTFVIAKNEKQGSIVARVYNKKKKKSQVKS